MGTRSHSPDETDSALALAIATANDALLAVRNGPLMDSTSELCWNCNAAAACSIDDARKKIVAAMKHLREALDGAAQDMTEPRETYASIEKSRQLSGRAAVGFADE